MLKPEANQFLKLEFYEKFEDMLTHVVYQANKCEFSQQGEIVAKESLEKQMEAVWSLNDTTLKDMAKMGFGAQRE